MIAQSRGMKWLPLYGLKDLSGYVLAKGVLQILKSALDT